MKKLEYYGVKGIPNKWIASYLSNRKQFVSLNGCKSNLDNVNCEVPQGSILGHLLFPIYINDLHLAIKHSEVHHYADDDSVKFINKQVNQGQIKFPLTLIKLSLCFLLHLRNNLTVT